MNREDLTTDQWVDLVMAHIVTEWRDVGRRILDDPVVSVMGSGDPEARHGVISALYARLRRLESLARSAGLE